MRYIVAAHQGTFIIDPAEDGVATIDGNPQGMHYALAAATRLADLLANASQAPAIVHRQPLNYLPRTEEIYTARGPQQQ